MHQSGRRFGERHPYDGDFERPDAAIVNRAREGFEGAVELAQLDDVRFIVAARPCPEAPAAAGHREPMAPAREN